MHPACEVRRSSCSPTVGVAPGEQSIGGWPGLQGGKAAGRAWERRRLVQQGLACQVPSICNTKSNVAAPRAQYRCRRTSACGLKEVSGKRPCALHQPIASGNGTKPASTFAGRSKQSFCLAGCQIPGVFPAETLGRSSEIRPLSLQPSQKGCQVRTERCGAKPISYFPGSWGA
jgi:hypothetical protein